MRVFFIFTLFVCILPVRAMAQSADFDCSTIKPFNTKINITFETVDPVYELDIAASELEDDAANERQTKWLEENGLESLYTADDLVTQGLASGGWAMASNFRMRSKNVDWMGAYHCAFFEEVNLAVFYRTIIYIPEEFPPIAVNSKLFTNMNTATMQPIRTLSKNMWSGLKAI